MATRTHLAVAREAHPEDDQPARSWVRMARNRFWLIVPVLVLDVALTSRLPPPLAPGGGPGPDTPGWVSLSETVLRVVVMGVPLLMPLTRAPRSRPAWAVYGLGLASYVAAWGAVVWASDSAWSTSAVGSTALAWTSILLFTGVGLRSTLRFVPWYRPWMYFSAAALFTVVHTVPIAIIWNAYY